MAFEVDIQTKKDLDIFAASQDSKSIFGLFDFTTCKGGQSKLHQFLSVPLTDLDAINDRKDAISFFQDHLPIDLDIDKDTLSFAEYYQKHREYSLRRPTKIWRPINNQLLNKLRSSENYFVVEKGVKSIISILQKLYKFCKELEVKSEGACPNLFLKNNEKVFSILSIPEMKVLLDIKDIKAYDIAEYNYTFRYSQQRNLQFIFELIYEYDAYLAIAKAAQEYKFCYPEVLPQSENCLKAEKLFHPFVTNAVSNDIEFGKDSNLLFVTGPNMAGKSTFLKSLGVAVYLAHAGFPVPADSFRMSLISGLCTTINISDNLESGYSHFYAEVLRVKHVAKRLKTNSNMLVIFDELFRGTNVKDAYDGTLAIVSAFAQIKSSFFVISTHIVEAAEELKVNENISFRCFEIKEENGHPVYTYKLKDGVSADRLGMYIIRRERVVEMINEVLTNNSMN